MRHIVSSILSVLSEAEVAGLKLVQHVVKDKIRYPLDICTVGVVLYISLLSTSKEKKNAGGSPACALCICHRFFFPQTSFMPSLNVLLHWQ